MGPHIFGQRLHGAGVAWAPTDGESLVTTFTLSCGLPASSLEAPLLSCSLHGGLWPHRPTGDPPAGGTLPESRVCAPPEGPLFAFHIFT